MIVSVIVPTHGNRDLTLLKNSIPDDPNVELIIVDEGKERSVQRNLGIARATGKYILWLDSDQSLSEGLIEECMEWIRSGVDALYIPEVIIGGEVTPLSFFGEIRKFEREFYTGTPIDCVRLVRKDIFPMFSTELIGPEDSDMDRRVKGRRETTINPLYHHDDISVWEYFRKKSFYAKSMRKYAEKWPNDKCLDWKYRCFGVFTENGKWKKIIRHPLLSLGVLTIIFIRGIIYVKR